MGTHREVKDFLSRAGFNVLEAAMENIYVSDVEGNIVYFNPAAEESLGYKLDELVGKSIRILYRDKEISDLALEDIGRRGKPKVYEAVILDKLGREHIYSVKKSPLWDPEKGLVGFLAVSRDVTRERLNEEELRAMKEFNEAVLNSAQDMITVTDPDGMVTYFNPAAERITGYRRDEVLGRNFTMFYRDKDVAAEKLGEIVTRARAEEYEAVIIDKKGREHIFSIHKAPLFDDDRRLIGFTATSRDVTEIRAGVEELRRLKEFNEAVLNSVHDLVVVTDVEGLIAYYNPTAERTTGFTLEEIKGRHISELYKNPGFAEQKLEFIRETGEANSYEAVILTKDGQERVLEINKAPLHDAEGKRIGFAAVSRDVTRRKMAEDRVCELESVLSERSPVQVESELIHTRAAEMISPNFQTCRPDDPMAGVAERLVHLDLPGLPVVGPVGEALGVVTMRDIIENGFFQRLDPDRPISEVMRTEFTAVPPDTYYFDALTAMVRTRLPILLVAEGRHLRGVLTMADLMRSRGVNVISLLDGIEAQQTVEDLAAFRPEIDRILISLVTGGARASQVTGIITEFNDRLTRRIVEICQKSLGPAPAAFAWLGLGSEGRKEQTLTTDQDNAIVIEDKGIESEDAFQYFARLADEVVAALAVCGFKLCDGGIMANKPRWAGGLTVWLNRVQSWVDEPTPERTRDAMTFLDFRGVYGNRELARQLRESTNDIVRANRRLLTPMAEDTLSKAPPLGLFKRFLVEKSGPHKGTLNIKTQGALVLIDCLRLLAVNEGLFETNTLERLHGLVQKQVLTPSEAETLTEAYDTLMGLRLLSHVQSLKENTPLTSRINPDLLPAWRQQRLKDAFTAAEDLQKKVKKVFWWVK